MFKYMKYMMLAMAIIDKASDGELTRDEVIECLKGVIPDEVDQVVEEINENLKDGRLSVGEVIRVLANSHLLDQV